METDYEKIKLHPLFIPIQQLYEFYILGIGFVGMPEFQRLFLNVNPGLKPLIERYNKEVNLQIEGKSVKSETKVFMVQISRMMAIVLFDILQFSKYQNKINKTEIFKFAKHIRNGAAHDNKFYFEHNIKRQIVWRDKIITNDLAGSEIFPNFISANSLIFLMSDITKIIN